MSVQINGVVLEEQTHKDAVELFRTAGEEVELRVQKKVGGIPITEATEVVCFSCRNFLQL